MFCVRSVRAWGPSTGPTACALAGRRCSLWGWRKGVPGGGAFHHCEGRLRSGAVPPLTAPPLGGLLGSATHVPWARVCGCGGPTLSPWEIWDRECGPFWPTFPVFATLGRAGNTTSPCGKEPIQKCSAISVAIEQGSSALGFRICSPGLPRVMQHTVRATLPNLAFLAVLCPVV